MAFVPGYLQDVFVSYAHIDDRPLSGAERGWVTTLVRNLETVVGQKLGAKEFTIWIDHELTGNRPLTPAIIEAISSTAVLVVIMSPGYLASEWCQRERETFLPLVRSRVTGGGQLFVVHYDKSERETMPPEFRDLRGYSFWVEEGESKVPRPLGIPVPTPAQTEYYNRVNQLGFELSEELKRLKLSGRGSEPQKRGPAVFLAEVTDDLEVRREEVRRYLSQAGFSTLPQAYYPRDDAAALAKAMKADLAQCKRFVQLLSGLTGRKSSAFPKGFPALQFQLAKEQGIPIVQWRSRDLELKSVEDPDQRALLEGETVCACGIEEFKLETVKDKEEPARSGASRARADVQVFINADAPDRELAEQVGKALYEQGIGCSMPLEAGRPEEIRTDLEENLLNCDGLLLIYGASSAGWVRSQLRHGRKVIAQRNTPPSSTAVFLGPPPEKTDLDLMLPNLLQLDCRAGFDRGSLRQFIDGLRG